MIHPTLSGVAEPTIAEALLYLLAFLVAIALMTLVMAAIGEILDRLRWWRAKREEQLPDQGDDDDDDHDTIDPAATVDYVPPTNTKEIDNG